MSGNGTDKNISDRACTQIARAVRITSTRIARQARNAREPNPSGPAKAQHPGLGRRIREQLKAQACSASGDHGQSSECYCAKCDKEESEENKVRPAWISVCRVATKLTSISEYFGADDKENADARAELPNPKKRTKTTTTTVATADAKTAARPGSRLKTTTTTVLSPKSHNPRVPPRSPLKSTFAGKPSSVPEKPSSSPTKPASQNPSTRAPSRQTTKRPATAMAAPTGKKRDSEGSSTSAGTTIVTKSGAKKGAPARKAPAARPQSAAATTKRSAAVKKEPIATAITAAGRTLRMRG